VYNFAPSTCCQLAGADDMAALSWMKISLPAEARVGIASSNLSLSSSTSMQAAGSDAGIWVTPLTNLTSASLPFATDFSQPDVHGQICQQKITHLYVGGMGRNFELAKLQSQPAWYRIVFNLPKAQVIQVLGCSSSG